MLGEINMDEIVIEVLKTDNIVLDWEKVKDELFYQCTINGSPISTGASPYEAIVNCITKHKDYVSK